MHQGQRVEQLHHAHVLGVALAALHGKLDATMVHEDVHSEDSLHSGPKEAGRGYFEQKPLLYCFVAGPLTSNRDALHGQFLVSKEPIVNAPKPSFDGLGFPFLVPSVDVQDSDLH